MPSLIITYIRSAVFNILFYLIILISLVVSHLLQFFMTRKQHFALGKSWAKIQNFLLEKITKTSFQIEGLENLPKGKCIIAAEHQAFWDTFALWPWLEDPTFILKHTILWIPLVRSYCKKQKMIGINRKKNIPVMKKIIKRSQEAMNDNRQLVIYPEGTRRIPEAKPVYKKGISYIYDSLQVPVIPIVMNFGLFWPRRSLIRYPGKFKVRILPPIPPNMSKDVFFIQLKKTMEYESNRLLLETIKDNPHIPFKKLSK
ncbi:LOW QUALITY PROTEIN: 1-acyl-sn-glycerol-3-phosphate acyltransferase [Liberibacter crescens BT-1]|uniref:1-acyl-sn-glycerol-3-phosphate acyltransferase n=2 Tax=Liberibacter crescens TaxID=1273132 RepID=L0EU94_LIBCB|nr:LOW QUALITY PROTEIN: 1-acyl-sn-glycerol-3-phosphate acyltransferase [Liberibacter crescens BT-1]